MRDHDDADALNEIYSSVKGVGATRLVNVVRREFPICTSPGKVDRTKLIPQVSC
jgi:hypothetical protein